MIGINWQTDNLFSMRRWFTDNDHHTTEKRHDNFYYCIVEHDVPQNRSYDITPV